MQLPNLTPFTRIYSGSDAERPDAEYAALAPAILLRCRTIIDAVVARRDVTGALDIGGHPAIYQLVCGGRPTLLCRGLNGCLSRLYAASAVTAAELEGNWCAAIDAVADPAGWRRARYTIRRRATLLRRLQACEATEVAYDLRPAAARLRGHPVAASEMEADGRSLLALRATRLAIRAAIAEPLPSLASTLPEGPLLDLGDVAPAGDAGHVLCAIAAASDPDATTNVERPAAVAEAYPWTVPATARPAVAAA